MSEAKDLLADAVNRIANSVSSFDDGIDKMRNHINKTIYEADKLARAADISISKELPIGCDTQEWTITLGVGLQAPMFAVYDEDGNEFLTLDSVIAKKSKRSREVVVALFKTLPDILKELELLANEKRNEVSELLKTIK